MFLAQQPPTGRQHLLLVVPRARQIALRVQRSRQIEPRRQGCGMFLAQQPPTGLQHLLELLARARRSRPARAA